MSADQAKMSRDRIGIPKARMQYRLLSMLTVVAIAAVTFALLKPKRRDSLHLLHSSDFTCADISRAVNHFVNLGEVEACREFNRLVDQYDRVDQLEIEIRIGWLCRILYEPVDAPLRPPGQGSFELPRDQMPLDTWPLYPVARSGNSFCVLSQHHSLLGRAECLRDYIRYCQSKGKFRTKPVSIPTRSEAVRDIGAIRTSKRWTTIRWANAGQGFSYKIDEQWIWGSIIAQAESMGG